MSNQVKWEDMLTVTQAMARYGVCRDVVYKWIHRGLVRCCRRGTDCVYYIMKEDADRITNPDPEFKTPDPGTPPTETPSLKKWRRKQVSNRLAKFKIKLRDP